MAKIDSLISTLVQNGIPIATIQPGKPVLLDMGGGATKTLSDRVITAKQVEMLLEEIASPDQWELLRTIGRIEFEYQSGAGTVTVMGLRRQSKLALYITLSKALEDRRMDDAVELTAESSIAVVESITRDSMEVADFSHQEGLNSNFSEAEVRPAAVQVVPQQKAASLGEERRIPFNPPGQSAPIDRLFRIMDAEGCSDLHISSGNPPLFRKDGEIVAIGNELPLSPSEAERLILPITPDRKYEEFIETRDTDFAYEIAGVGRFRCNIFMDRKGPGAVFRIIPSDIMTAEDLKLPPKVLELCYLSKGLVVVTGPTGSGKSTTLAAMIDYINRHRAAHIITIEDPIEFVHDNKKCLINQREVGVHTMGFKNALRAALREDPDIVLVGEMRDLETIAIAMETAETGHLVFGTLHTNTAPSTVDRIIDQFPADRQAQIRTMLSESLKAVVAQTLCKKIGGGRAAALEILMIDHAMSNLIREGKTFQIPSMMGTKKALGNVSLNDTLIEMVNKKQVEPLEAYTKAVEKGSFRKMLERDGHRLNI